MLLVPAMLMSYIYQSMKTDQLLFEVYEYLKLLRRRGLGLRIPDPVPAPDQLSPAVPEVTFSTAGTPEGFCASCVPQWLQS